MMMVRQSRDVVDLLDLLAAQSLLLQRPRMARSVAESQRLLMYQRMKRPSMMNLVRNFYEAPS
jgi:hypothetical protein